MPFKDTNNIVEYITGRGNAQKINSNPLSRRINPVDPIKTEVQSPSSFEILYWKIKVDFTKVCFAGNNARCICSLSTGTSEYISEFGEIGIIRERKLTVKGEIQ